MRDTDDPIRQFEIVLGRVAWKGEWRIIEGDIPILINIHHN